MSHGAALSTCAVAEHVLAWLSSVDLPVLAVYNINFKLCMLKLAAICNSWFQEEHCRRGNFPKASKTRGERSVWQVYTAGTVLNEPTIEWNMSITRQPARFIGIFRSVEEVWDATCVIMSVYRRLAGYANLGRANWLSIAELSAIYDW